MTVDRGQYERTRTPWEEAAWREAALGWAQGELAALGLGEGRLHTVRLRPWSVLMRLTVRGPVVQGPAVQGRSEVWFKANPPASSFEAGLTAQLARWVPEHVLTPLAVDARRGWSLLPDGGALFRHVLDRGPGGPGDWEELLRRYAQMQRALLPHTARMEQLGVPSARTAVLPEVFDRAVAANHALTPADRTALDALRPRLTEWCEELAQTGIGDSLDHSDLHDGQIFAPGRGRFTFFDWGDAAVSHPFCSFLVPAGAARERYGPDVLPRLRDAYLEPWAAAGTGAAELRRAVSLAWRLGAIGRACSWGRLFPGASADGDAAEGTASAHWLLRLAAEPPL